MIKEGLIMELKTVKEFFDRSTSCLQEADSGFAPKEGMYTVSNHMAHTAQSIDWFMDGMFSPKGFDMDFEVHIKAAMDCKSLTDAREWFTRSIANAIEIISTKTDEQLQESLPEGPVMGGAPRLAVISGISEHTAHHRGALTVYSRLLGKVPPMPYGDF